MRVLLYGASGMIGQGVLQECLGSINVDEVHAVVRTTLPVQHAKLQQYVQADVGDLSPLGDLGKFDACFFPLGVSSFGKSEAEYARITYDLTMRIAQPLAAANPKMRFVYVSGAGTASSEKSLFLWARVKGRTENALFALPFDAWALRPGLVQPGRGIRSRTRWYRALYWLLKPVLRTMERWTPGLITDTRMIGLTMIFLGNGGWSSHTPRTVETKDINGMGAEQAQWQIPGGGGGFPSGW